MHRFFATKNRVLEQKRVENDFYTEGSSFFIFRFLLKKSRFALTNETAFFKRIFMFFRNN